jgi:hypothetical protein
VIQCMLAEPVTEGLVMGLKFLDPFRSVYPPTFCDVKFITYLLTYSLTHLLTYFMEQSPSF